MANKRTPRRRIKGGRKAFTKERYKMTQLAKDIVENFIRHGLDTIDFSELIDLSEVKEDENYEESEEEAIRYLERIVRNL